MILLLSFAFLAGLVTILSPCILPILPIVLSSSVDSGKRRPIGIVAGFIGSFTFFTLTLSYIVKTTGLSADGLRTVAIGIIAVLGISMITPRLQVWLEKVFSTLSGLLPHKSGETGFIGGIFVGLSLGLLWAPCVGPILASVITLAATNTVTLATILITFAYSIGTALPMLGIMYGGRTLLNRVPWLLASTQKIQKIFGIIMIVTAVAIYFNADRTFQTYVLEKFPAYGVGLTKFEENANVKKALDVLIKKRIDSSAIGKPMNEVLNEQVGLAPEFIAGGAWINSKPLTLKELRGKVVLVDFWTYTCINCIRTLPYIKAWHEKYKDKGLVIVGVHTPEFAFERDVDNVEKAVKDFGIQYPVVQDNEYETWRAYDNHYWPAKYLIDKNGKLRDTHFGEGAYDETEAKIQMLLAETGISGLEAPSNSEYSINSRTPELYLGYDRIAHFASPENIVTDKDAMYTSPRVLYDNSFSYQGTWKIGGEYATPKRGATLILQFEAQEVFLVMRPTKNSGTVRVFLDNAPVSELNRGSDVINSEIQIDSDRLYKIIKLPNPGKHILRLEFLDDTLELFAFTFG